MLAFYDPDSVMQMDPEIFPSLHLGQTEMLPVCAADADGKPLFDLEGEVSVPLLAYSAGAFLGRSVNQLLRQRALRFTPVYETAMAHSPQKNRQADVEGKSGSIRVDLGGRC